MIDRFLDYLRYELHLSPLTVRSYGSDLRQWNDFVTGGNRDVEWSSLSSADVRGWLVQRSQQGDCARTLRRKVQAVRALFRYLMRQGVVSDNPAAEIELARLPRHLPHFIREQQLDVALDSEVDEDDFTEVRDRLMLMMFYQTGIRRAELIGLQDANVDTDTCQIKVHGKRDKERIVPFGDELKQWIDHYRELRLRWVEADCPHFFVTLRGGAIYPSLVYHVVHDRLEQAGCEGQLSPHVLRHSCASALLNNGAQLTSVKEILGHESLSTTQIYTHVTLSELKHNYKLAHPRALKHGE